MQHSDPNRRGWAFATLVTALLIMGLFGFFATKVERTGDATALLAANDATVELKKKMEERFGSANVLILTTPIGITADTLTSLAHLQRQLDSIQELEKVHSVFTTPHLASDASGFEVGSLLDLDSTLESTPDPEALLQRLKSNPSYRGNIVSLNYDILAMVLQFHPEISDPQKLSILQRSLKETGISLGTGEADWQLSGLPQVNSAIVELIERDLFLLFPLFMIILGAVLYVAFRSFWAVAIPLVLVGFGTTVTVGAMALLGESLNVVTNNVPMLLTCIGGAYSIHYLQHLRHLQKSPTSHSTRGPLGAARSIFPTLFLASTTTILGFLANLTSEVEAVQNFGLFMAIGLAVLFVATVLVFPSVLVAFDITVFKSSPDRSDSTSHKTESQNKENRKSILQGRGHKTAWTVIALSTIGVLAGGYAFGNLRAEYRTLGYFEDDSSIVQQARHVSRHFGGFGSYDIVLQQKETMGSGSSEDTTPLAMDASVLKTVSEFSTWMKQNHPHDVQVTLDFADSMKDMSRAFNGPEHYQVPDSNDEVFQYIEVYSWSGDLQDDLGNFVKEDFSSLRLMGRLSLQEHPDGTYSERSVQEHSALAQQGMNWLRDRLPDSIDVVSFGELPLWARVNVAIIEGQRLAAALAILLVGLVVLFIFRSLKLTFLCLIPVSLSVLCSYLAMWFFDINLDIATSLVSSMAIGIGIDDTLHFMLAYRNEFQRTGKVRHSLEQSLSNTGRAILFTSIALVTGFGVFALSNFKPVVYFGFLNGLTILVATVATLVVLPAGLLLFTRDKQPVAAEAKVQ